MCPPSSLEARLAFTTMASAFQRTSERSRHSMAGSPGMRSSRCSGMVFMYAVFAEYGRYAPERRALSINRSSR
ncbi:MAG: hypothetical protein HONDAALG_01392 [Gammaproteobacteria bacterium]|nr:hypothetical protein [Gammaproteobacteria bacterium]